MFEEAEADFRAGRGTRTHGESETRRFLDSLKKLGAAKKPAKKSPKRAAKR
jgi:hypothetical protein